MKPTIYNEYKVELTIKQNGDFTIDAKHQTKRGTVSIHEHEAEENNRRVKSTKLWYEPAKVEPKNSELEAAKKEADELGIQYSKNISLDNLLKKIETHKNQ